MAFKERLDELTAAAWRRSLNLPSSKATPHDIAPAFLRSFRESCRMEALLNLPLRKAAPKTISRSISCRYMMHRQFEKK